MQHQETGNPTPKSPKINDDWGSFVLLCRILCSFISRSNIVVSFICIFELTVNKPQHIPIFCMSSAHNLLFFYFQGMQCTPTVRVLDVNND